ncbi:hypothetical protein [Micromonospora sp. WMMD712]|nr:hypothetical protein [Micromonospora sp. WMMD712]WFE58108.1 hypothetical protein O7633_15155 [Micromonospora sp. WMMD712]
MSRGERSTGKEQPHDRRWTKFVDTGEPFPVNLSIARITPRHL